MPFVLDNSVSASWCFADEANAYGRTVLRQLQHDGTAMVPVVWRLELANAILTATRRNRITLAHASDFLRELERLTILVDVEGLEHTFTTTRALATQHNLSAYDASYLELALRRGFPLATLDSRLQQAAAHAGVVLLAV